jgi:hypothetical protein
VTGKLSHTRPSDLTSTIEAYLKGNGMKLAIKHYAMPIAVLHFYPELDSRYPVQGRLN